MLKTKPASNEFVQKLFREHNTNLLKFLNRKLADPEEAADVAQAAYEKMMGVSGIENLENAKSYLYQTALNLAIDRMRKQQRSSNYQAVIADHMEQSEDALSPSPEKLVASRQELLLIQQALRELPDNCRQAFLMHRAQHLSYKEIGKELNVSVSMVEKHIIQALKHLRHKLRGF